MKQIHQQLIEEISSLSQEKASQVFDFIQFILYQGEKQQLEVVEDEKYAFDAVKLDTVGFFFDREKANAR